MKKIIFILLIFICYQTFAEAPVFEKGNEKYTNGDYSGAESIYDSIISFGLESSELYYNLGNCHYKQQDWANAIWHYEKSLQLNITNQNTIYNLGLAKLRIIDQIEEIPKLFYKKWIKNITSLFNTKNWQIIALLSIWIVLIIQILRKFLNYKRKYLSDIFIILALISIFISYHSYEDNFIKNEAIIFSAAVVVNSAPTDNSTNLFSLHAGTKVTVIDQIGNWINIKIINGNSGWIKETNCKALN